ncbi:MAG TPA: class I SAM-dependent methyltransferase [Candidatus Gallacutalibacter stercoravium]|nr:class I SAM-dependent methyltransferase [Candidatus Gallacutalibacter stercoravium]
MKDLKIDNGQGFDFGKTALEYAKYRDIYPKELYDRLLSLGVGRPDSAWLDLGTGTGTIPRGLADHGANIIGVDISSQQIEQAKKLSEDYKNITYIACSVEDLTFADNSFDTITACQCFWYFDPKIIVDKIKRMIKPNGLFLKLYMSYLKDDPIAGESHSLVQRLNPNWVGGSPALQDLNTHYFDNPKTESFTIDLPFTRESWHGRIKACRGVLASMDQKTFQQFEEAHLKMLQQLPEQFTIKHKVFLTYYHIAK